MVAPSAKSVPSEMWAGNITVGQPGPQGTRMTTISDFADGGIREMRASLPAMAVDPPSPGPLDRDERKRLRSVLIRFQKPSTARALWQLSNTLVPYALLWVLMWYVKDISLWLAIPLAMLAGTLLVRVFIFFHDCGHDSFFKSHWANAIFGFLCGVLTFTPYYHWRWQHAIHHGTSSKLDKRGVGDIWTMTVQEYLESTRWKRFSYRFQRNPFVLFVIAPLYIFLFRQRFAAADASPRERYSVWLMNLALLILAVLMSWAFGFWTYLLLQIVAWMVAGAS